MNTHRLVLQLSFALNVIINVNVIAVSEYFSKPLRGSFHQAQML